MNTQELWRGKFGDDYVRRQAPNLDGRMEIWRRIIPRNCYSILEVGANTGANLEAIGNLGEYELYASEPNDLAREELSSSGFISPSHVNASFANDIKWPAGIAHLVITSGLLIHIRSDQLIESMREIHRCSSRWIISAEYFSPSEEMIPYRGHKDALWRRDYGSIWLDNFPDLKCTGVIFAWKRLTGLDNLTFWRFEKMGPRSKVTGRWEDQ